MKPLAVYTVPTAPFLKLAQQYVTEQNIDMGALSQRCGLARDTLGKILQNREVMRFDTADTIMVHTYGPMMWHSDSFIEIYWQGQVPPDRAKPVKCQNPKCDVWMEVDIRKVTGAATGGTYIRDRKFCSPNCKGAYRRATKPASHMRAVRKHRQKNREWYTNYMREWRARKKAESCKK